MKKIFVADIVEAFGCAASGVGHGLKYAWDTTTGNKRLEKRGLKRNDFVGPGTVVGSLLGGALSFITGTVVLLATRNNELATQVWLSLWGTAAGGSIVAGQLSSIYRCSVYNRKQYVLEKQKNEATAALPPPPRKLT